MRVKTIFFAASFLGLCFTSCTNPNKKASELQTQDTISTNKPSDMKSYISIFEIPATDLSRAVDFYQGILGIKIEKMDLPEIQMAEIIFR